LDLLTYKTTFLLAIASAKRVSELQALSKDPKYLQITPAGIRLRLNPAFIPKVNVEKNREQELVFTPFCQRTNAQPRQTYYRLCVRRVVKKYLRATQSFRRTDQLLVCFQGQRKGLPASKPTISRWVRKAIEMAYKVLNKPLPEGIKAHQTRATAATWAQFYNASLKDICETASWGSTCTFAKHYQLNIADSSEATARFADAVFQAALDSDDGL
jgi:integrase